jgi:hypothetical protein
MGFFWLALNTAAKLEKETTLAGQGGQKLETEAGEMCVEILLW